jgi:hypothetical protein
LAALIVEPRLVKSDAVAARTSGPTITTTSDTSLCDMTKTCMSSVGGYVNYLEANDPNRVMFSGLNF